MISLRSRLSFLKGLATSAATCACLSGSSRGPLAGALGDLRVTVRASPSGTSPRTSYSSHSKCPVRFPGDFAGPSQGALSISFGAPSEDRVSIAESGDGLTSSEDEGVVGLPPSGVVDTAAPDPELTAMPARAAVSIGLEVNRQPSPEPSRLDDWFLGAGHSSQPRSAPVPFFRRCMRSWRSRRWPLSRPEAARLLRPHYPRWWGCQGVHGHSPSGESGRGAPVPTKRQHLAGLPGRAVRRHRRGLCPAVLGGKAADRGDPAHPAPAWCTDHRCPRGQASCVLLLCPRLNRQAGASSLSQESGAPRIPTRPQVVQEVNEAALTWETRRCWSLLFLRRRREQCLSFPWRRAGRRTLCFFFFRYTAGPISFSSGFSGPWDDSVQCPASSLSPTTHFASSQESAVRGRSTSPRTSSQSRLGPREFGEDASECAAFCTIQPYSLSLHHHRYVDCAIGAACMASGGVAHAVFFPDRGPPRHGRTGTQLASGYMQVCVSPSEPTRTDTVQAQGGRGVDPAGCATLAQPDLVSQNNFPCDSPSLAHSSEKGPPLSGARHHMAPIWSKSVEPPCVAPGRDAADLSGLPPAVVETITQARAPSTRQTYALKWSLFTNWCSSCWEDPRRCMIEVVLSFLQKRLECRLSPSTLKVYVAAIMAHYDAVDGLSLGKHELIVRFLKGAMRMNPSRPPLVPSWDLSIVLAGLQRGPLEPLNSVKLKFLSAKTALLTMLTSIKRVGDLQAFLVSEKCLVFGPAYSHIVLRPRPGYVPKVPTTPLPQSGGEPASTALGGGRSSLSVAVSRKSIEHIHGQHSGASEALNSSLSAREVNRKVRLSPNRGWPTG